MLVHDIFLLCTLCEEVSVKHVFREANFTANVVANLGHWLSPSKLWEHGLPLNYSLPFILIFLGLRARVVSICNILYFSRLLGLLRQTS